LKEEPQYLDLGPAPGSVEFEAALGQSPSLQQIETLRYTAGLYSTTTAGAATSQLQTALDINGHSKINTMTTRAATAVGLDPSNIFSPLVETHLMTSTGALSALLINAKILGIKCHVVRHLKTIHVDETTPTPPSLKPTALQLREAHLPYIDLIPFPSLRDNLLRAGSLVGVAEMWVDLINHVRVWGKTPWERRGWEFQEAFVSKWWWLVDDEVLDEANFWRVSRGEEHIDLEVVKGGQKAIAVG
jgi:hypothetical protein